MVDSFPKGSNLPKYAPHTNLHRSNLPPEFPVRLQPTEVRSCTRKVPLCPFRIASNPRIVV